MGCPCAPLPRPGIALAPCHVERATRRKSRPRIQGDGCDVRSVEDFTAHNVRSIVELEAAARANRGRSQRFAHTIASFCGSMPFVWLHVALFAGWITLNTLPGLPHPDPFPFIFLTLLVSLEAIFLSTIILISQNEETRLAERRNALALQINLLAEQENTKMLRMLECVARKVGAGVEDDPALAVLEQATRPERLAEQIDRAAGN
jgi:uncharacterized membrane protein